MIYWKKYITHISDLDKSHLEEIKYMLELMHKFFICKINNAILVAN